MSDLKVFRSTGAFGLATVVFWLSQFPLYMVSNAPSVYDGVATSQHLKSISTIAFTRILLDRRVLPITVEQLAAQCVEQADQLGCCRRMSSTSSYRLVVRRNRAACISRPTPM
jgi:hypothetical protein